MSTRGYIPAHLHPVRVKTANIVFFHHYREALIYHSQIRAPFAKLSPFAELKKKKVPGPREMAPCTQPRDGDDGALSPVITPFLLIRLPFALLAQVHNTVSLLFISTTTPFVYFLVQTPLPDPLPTSSPFKDWGWLGSGPACKIKLDPKCFARVFLQGGIACI